jgi:hypothetical protein
MIFLWLNLDEIKIAATIVAISIESPKIDLYSYPLNDLSAPAKFIPS